MTDSEFLERCKGLMATDVAVNAPCRMVLCAWCEGHPLSDERYACLWREHLRGWLEVYCRRIKSLLTVEYRHPSVWIGWLDEAKEELQIGCGPDENTALIAAAAEAVLDKEQGDD